MAVDETPGQTKARIEKELTELRAHPEMNMVVPPASRNIAGSL
jgi:hypothetical protein